MAGGPKMTPWDLCIIRRALLPKETDFPKWTVSLRLKDVKLRSTESSSTIRVHLHGSDPVRSVNSAPIGVNSAADLLRKFIHVKSVAESAPRVNAHETDMLRIFRCGFACRISSVFYSNRKEDERF